MNKHLWILPILFLAVTGCAKTAIPVSEAKVTSSTVPSKKQGTVVYGMRKFPYPYKAMLAISSDADHETLRKFNLVHELLNTTELTPMGKGLGLDISDSFFMYNGSNIQTYTDVNHLPLTSMLTWYEGTSSIPYGATILNDYIKAGWIDTLHTYGDFSMTNQTHTRFTRYLAKQAINTLNQHGDNLTVWTDHGNMSNMDNFGSYGTRGFYTYQQGANSWSPYYHTDLLIPYGVKFVWADGHSNIFGQPNTIYPLRLPDGRKVWGFYRYTDIGRDAKKNVLWVWTANDMPKELSRTHFDEIIKNYDYAIVASHFYANNNELPFTSATIDSLKALQQEYLNGNILVARTSRLLAYNVLQKYLQYKVTQFPGKTIINIEGVADPIFGWSVPTVDSLHGITFYTSNPEETVIEIAGIPVPLNVLQVNKTDGYAPSIGFKWYPSDTTNYAISPPGIY